MNRKTTLKAAMLIALLIGTSAQAYAQRGRGDGQRPGTEQARGEHRGGDRDRGWRGRQDRGGNQPQWQQPAQPQPQPQSEPRTDRRHGGWQPSEVPQQPVQRDWRDAPSQGNYGTGGQQQHDDRYRDRSWDDRYGNGFDRQRGNWNRNHQGHEDRYGNGWNRDNGRWNDNDRRHENRDRYERRDDRRDEWRDDHNDRRDHDRSYDHRGYDRGHHQDQYRWNNGWRNDRRYDWRGHRNHYRDHYRRPGHYYAPGRHHRYSRFSIGVYIGSGFYHQNYWLNDPWQYRLPPVYGPYRWVRYYDDVLLVDVRNGHVVDVIHDFFW